MGSHTCKWVVTRQRPYYQAGVSLVEVARGGIDNSGSDALVARYAGEFTEHAACVDAVRAAIAIRDAWRADWDRAEHGADEEPPVVGIGDTGGGMMEIRPTSHTDEELLALAAAHDERAPKCERCQAIFADDHRWRANEWDGLEYCEPCAEKVAAEEYRDDTRFNVGEQAAPLTRGDARDDDGKWIEAVVEWLEAHGRLHGGDECSWADDDDVREAVVDLGYAAVDGVN